MGRRPAAVQSERVPCVRLSRGTPASRFAVGFDLVVVVLGMTVVPACVGFDLVVVLRGVPLVLHALLRRERV
jgi:hypothetical protein